jgi:hypothetical protein
VTKLRKRMLAVAVVALPLGFMAAVAGPSLSSSAATIYFPITCAVHGTVNYSPALTQLGTNSTSANNENTTISGASVTGCLSSNAIDGGTTTGTVTIGAITSAPVKFKLGKTTFYSTGQCAAFGSPATLKAIKGIGNITTTWAGNGDPGGTTVVFAKSGSIYANSETGEAGFNVAATFVSGDYTVKSAQLTAFLDNSGAIGQCGTSAVVVPLVNNQASYTLPAPPYLIPTGDNVEIFDGGQGGSLNGPTTVASYSNTGVNAGVLTLSPAPHCTPISGLTCPALLGFSSGGPASIASSNIDPAASTATQ